MMGIKVYTLQNIWGLAWNLFKPFDQEIPPTFQPIPLHLYNKKKQENKDKNTNVLVPGN